MEPRYIKYLVGLNILFMLSILFSYSHHSEKQSKKIAHTIEEKIFIISKVVFNNLIDNNFKDFENDFINYDITDNEIVISNHTKSINYPIFELVKTIEKFVPLGLKFQIKLNNKILYSNEKYTVFDVFKKYHLNHNNYFGIMVLPKTMYNWHLIGYILLMLSIVLVINFILILKIFNTTKSKIFNKYKRTLKAYKKNHSLSLQKKENELLTRIWENERIKTQDIELNYLFAKNTFNLHAIDTLNNQSKTISIDYIASLLKNRFKLEKEVTVVINYKNCDVQFLSEILLCQWMNQD